MELSDLEKVLRGAERMNDYMPTDKQYDGQLIRQYQMLKQIRSLATKEGAT